MNYCKKKCHYTGDSSNVICEECLDGFYLNNDNTECIKCKDPKRIENGYFIVCSDDENEYESGQCWCVNYYTIKDHSTCVKCPDNCEYCKIMKKQIMLNV